jgi:endonuclease/exonuclease/phosphatase family metal-dependent hydrolase
LLSALLGLCLLQLDLKPATGKPDRSRSVTLPMLGVYLVLTLVWFAFSAPAVIVRWTQANYLLVTMAVSLLSLLWVWLGLRFPGWMERISPRLLLAWNLLFTLALTRTLLAGRVDFPPTLQSPPVIVGPPSLWQHLPLGIMLLLFPVIFVDLRRFIGQIQAVNPSPRQLAPGLALGGLLMILLVFINIFTNVWAYVPPVSPLFRNLYWLPFFLLAGAISLLAWPGRQTNPVVQPVEVGKDLRAWLLGLAVIFVSTLLFAAPARLSPPAESGRNSLVAMTYNTQQFNTEDGEKAFREQVELVRRANPDILALQESDSARISFNNNDYVRYFAETLGYYAYYGPTPVTGTFGTAILSRYPLENPRSVFIYSDNDETGVAEAEVVIEGKRFTIFNVHPDGSDPQMLLFARTVLERASGQSNLIVLGDFNLRDTEEPYQLFDAALVNAWTSVYPSKISLDGLDMSGRNRIDHIFTTPDLTARNPVYVLPPESFTDHPVHWTELVWTNP